MRILNKSLKRKEDERILKEILSDMKKEYEKKKQIEIHKVNGKYEKKL
jgi:hypothetical protein